jgi:hypothetical protein
MRFIKFVQSGDYEQSEINGMGLYTYSFGASTGHGGLFSILTDDGVSGQDWSIPEEHATTFKLQFFF